MQGTSPAAWGGSLRNLLRVRDACGGVKCLAWLTPLGLAGVIAGCSGGDRPQKQAAQTSIFSSAPTGVDRYSAKTGSSSSPRVFADGQSIPKGGGHYKLGSSYKIANRWYTPAEDLNYDRNGIASWYGADFHGRKTANGEIFDMHALTAAHPTLPIPSYAYVTSLTTGRTVLVRINDRGPYAHDRIMDLSKRTAEVLGVAGAGISNVRVRYAGRAPLSGDDSHERRFLAGQPWSQTLAQSRPPAGRMGLLGK
jgi:rare lipoprotein A